MPTPPLPAGLRVALFSGNYNYLKEGANQALNRLVHHLEARAGAQVRVYSPVTATPAFEPAGTLVPVPSIPLPRRPELQLALRLPAAIRADVARFAPHIVHLSTPDILGARALTFAKRLGVPVVTSVHTRFETYFDYYGLGFVRRVAERHLDRFYRRSDFVLAPTPAIAAELAAKLGGDRVRTWGRGVDAGLFDPARRSAPWRAAHGIAATEVALLFFGRLVVEKGVDAFAETAHTLIARGYPIRPVIVGAGPARDRLAKALPSAVFAGHLDGGALATAVASCDILLNPSTTEAFGNVVLEAMASGLAIVAADTPSVTNLIAQGGTGLLADTNDAGRYADLVGQLAANAERRRSLGRAARAAALEWRWDRVLDDVLDVYAEALAR